MPTMRPDFYCVSAYSEDKNVPSQALIDGGCKAYGRGLIEYSVPFSAFRNLRLKSAKRGGIKRLELSEPPHQI
jgi:hypothetical protein